MYYALQLANIILQASLRVLLCVQSRRRLRASPGSMWRWTPPSLSRCCRTACCRLWATQRCMRRCPPYRRGHFYTSKLADVCIFTACMPSAAGSQGGCDRASLCSLRRGCSSGRWQGTMPSGRRMLATGGSALPLLPSPMNASGKASQQTQWASCKRYTEAKLDE
jgi:hypothetical protein